MNRIFLTIILVTFISKGISAQDAPSFDEFVKENSWYVSNVPTEKLSDPKNKIGEIGFEPFSFEMIPFEMVDQKFQYFIIADGDRMLVLKPMNLVRREFKELEQ